MTIGVSTHQASRRIVLAKCLAPEYSGPMTDILYSPKPLPTILRALFEFAWEIIAALIWFAVHCAISMKVQIILSRGSHI